MSPTTNIDYTYSLPCDGTEDADYDINKLDQVYCSFEGAFFVSFNFWEDIEIARTGAVWTSAHGGTHLHGKSEL